jgi:hypothetical protein
MASGDDLDSLSSKELHDRAMSVARHHLDVAFIWNLLTILPAAETAAGNPGAAELDVTGDPSLFNAPFGLLTDLLNSDKGKLADALRPYYIDYLRTHADHSHEGAGPASGS